MSRRLPTIDLMEAIAAKFAADTSVARLRQYIEETYAANSNEDFICFEFEDHIFMEHYENLIMRNSFPRSFQARLYILTCVEDAYDYLIKQFISAHNTIIGVSPVTYFNQMGIKFTVKFGASDTVNMCYPIG